MQMDPSRWPALAQAARAQVEAGWDRERLNDALIALYDKVLDGSGREVGSPVAKTHAA